MKNRFKIVAVILLIIIASLSLGLVKDNENQQESLVVEKIKLPDHANIIAPYIEIRYLLKLVDSNFQK